MIKVNGEARLVVKYEVEINMTEEEFENLSQRQQDAILEELIDWREECKNAEVDEIEVWDIDTTE